MLQSINTGGSTPHQYALPEDVRTIGELIRAKGFNQDQGTIIKLLYLSNDHFTGLHVQWTEVQDIFEGRDMGWSDANIFKAIYRMGTKNPNMYELNKARWFAQRQYNRKPSYMYRTVLECIDRLILEEQYDVLFNETNDLLGR